jgi:hypothetical protein
MDFTSLDGKDRYAAWADTQIDPKGEVAPGKMEKTIKTRLFEKPGF